MTNLQTKEDELKAKDLEVQQNLILFGIALDDLTKKSQIAKSKADKEEEEIKIKEVEIRKKQEELDKYTVN